MMGVDNMDDCILKNEQSVNIILLMRILIKGLGLLLAFKLLNVMLLNKDVDWEEYSNLYIIDFTIEFEKLISL
jgi:hypothetical protein